MSKHQCHYSIPTCHVLLFHGGGVTGLEQINDTHLHAAVQRLLEQIETNDQLEQRKADPTKLPATDKQTVVNNVREMWLSIDHAQVSDTGYRATGPTLPTDGSGDDDVFRDLKHIFDKIDAPALRREAFALVRQYWDDGVVSGWQDVHTLIEEHANHTATQEGQEHIPWDVVAEHSDLPGDGDSHNSGSEAAIDADEPPIDDEPAADGDANDDDDEVDPVIPWGGICTEDEYLAAMNVISQVS